MGNLSFSILLVLAMTMLVSLSGITVSAHSIVGGHHKKRLHLAKGGLCDGSLYKDLCNAVVQQPGVHGAASATNLAINSAIVHTSQAKDKANSLISVVKNFYMKSSLEVCVESYDDAISNLVKSLMNVKTKDIDSLLTNLSAAMTDYETCEDGFVEIPGGHSPVDNGLLSGLISNCLLFAGKIHVPQ